MPTGNGPLENEIPQQLAEAGRYPLAIKTTSDSHHVMWFTTEAGRDAFVADMAALDVLIRADGYDLDAITDDTAQEN
jgi:hypothetical protein